MLGRLRWVVVLLVAFLTGCGSRACCVVWGVPRRGRFARRTFFNRAPSCNAIPRKFGPSGLENDVVWRPDTRQGARCATSHCLASWWRWRWRAPLSCSSASFALKILAMLRCLAREMRKKGKTSAEIPSETHGEQLIEHELYYGMCTSGWGSRRMQPDNPSQQQLTKATP